MIKLLVRPEFKEAAVRTSANVVKLGTLAGIAVFANNLFKTQATSTLQLFKIDFCTIRELLRSN